MRARYSFAAKHLNGEVGQIFNAICIRGHRRFAMAREVKAEEAKLFRESFSEIPEAPVNPEAMQ